MLPATPAFLLKEVAHFSITNPRLNRKIGRTSDFARFCPIFYCCYVKVIAEICNVMRELTIIILVFLTGCAIDENKTAQQIEYIDIYTAFNSKKEAFLSEFVEEVKYIPLESAAESFISENARFKVEDLIIVGNSGINRTPLLLFNKKTGRFIRNIGKVGRGPDEYNIPAPDFYNVLNKTFYTLDDTHRNVKIFDTCGNYIGSFRAPEWVEPSISGATRYAYIEAYLNDSTYVHFTDNFNGQIKTKLVLFTRDHIIKFFPNFLSWGEKESSKNSRGSFSVTTFIRWNNNLYFKEMFNDTLFTVTIDTLIPRFVFRYGRYGLPYAQQDKIVTKERSINSDYLILYDMDENHDYLFFRFSLHDKNYTSFYSKKEKTTTVCITPDGSVSALTDDINGFMPVIPEGFTKNNEMISLLKPKDIMDWIHNNPEKAELLEQKFEWLRDITEFSNPIIFIAKCK